MLDKTTSKIWYGYLQSPSARTPVIYDPRLPPAPTGYIYLYNPSRDAVVPYLEEIVSPLLHDAPDTERRVLETDMSRCWRTARKKFMKENSHRLTAYRIVRSKRKAAPEPVQEDRLDDEVDFFDDDYEELEEE